jgi:ferric-dicitrate binding protein FerR (iron transport regulator)
MSDDLFDKYLTGALTPEETRRLAGLLRDDPRTGDALVRHVQETAMMVQIAGQFEAGRAASAMPPSSARLPAARRRAVAGAGRTWRRALVAASLLAAAGASAFAIREWVALSAQSPGSPGGAIFADGRPVARGAAVEAAGRPVLVSLGGYCRVQLAPGGALRVEGADRAEQVRLDRGRVTCEVDRNTGTFAVRTAAGTAQVLGTRFEARLADPAARAMAVTVHEGSVQLSGPRVKRLVAAGETAEVAAGDDNRLEASDGYLLRWAAAGPYRVEGRKAVEIFDIAFPPEDTGGGGVIWKPLTTGVGLWSVDLLQAVARVTDAAVYLRTRLWSPADQEVRLEMGSDDAIKVWVNGGLVHANNADRALEPVQDVAVAQLRAGWNELRFMVTNHEGPWGFGCRVVRPGGAVVPGLFVDGR